MKTSWTRVVHAFVFSNEEDFTLSGGIRLYCDSCLHSRDSHEAQLLGENMQFKALMLLILWTVVILHFPKHPKIRYISLYTKQLCPFCLLISGYVDGRLEWYYDFIKHYIPGLSLQSSLRTLILCYWTEVEFEKKLQVAPFAFPLHFSSMGIYFYLYDCLQLYWRLKGECWKPAVGKPNQGTNNSFRLKSSRCLENFMSIWCICKIENKKQVLEDI